MENMLTDKFTPISLRASDDAYVEAKAYYGSLIPCSAYMPIAALGVLKAGCAYQPLDPTYPEERLNFMVQDAAAKLLITTKELRPIRR